jgi:ABC-type transporter Mla subunit MlaD
MARTQPVRVNRAARTGLAALVVIILAAVGVYYIVQQRGTGGYRMGVRFAQAEGISAGSEVFLNGVLVGTVRRVQILPDTSVEFILGIFHDTSIPKNAQFTVRSTLTGTPSLLIAVPPSTTAAHEVWPKRVLPPAEQPVGTPALTLETFMASNSGLTSRAQRVLALARPYGKPMIAHLERARANGAGTMQELHATLPSLMGTLQGTIAMAKANAQSAQTALRGRNQEKIASIAASFKQSAADLEKTSQSLTALKRDPQVRENARQASIQLRATASTMAKLSDDMRAISANPQTKAELRDASARLKALLHKI